MAKTTVQHTLQAPDGTPQAGAGCVISLASAGFIDASQVEIVGSTVTHADATGLVSVQLEPNATIDPAGTWYVLTDPSGTQWTFTVPVSASPVWLRNILVTNPTTPSSSLGTSAVHAASDFLRSTGAAVYAIGDSITLNGTLAAASNADTTDGQIIFGNVSYLGYGLLQVSGRFRFGGLAAHTGYTSADILANYVAGAVASKSEYVHILAGTNDIGVLTLAQSQANIRSMVTQVLSAGKTVILGTVPPQNATTSGANLTQLTALNLWIRRYAASLGQPCVDYHAALVNPASNQFTTGYDSGDGIHPSNVGAKAMGDALAAVLNTVAGPVRPHLWDAYSPSALILPDVCITSAAGDKWTGSGNTTGATWSFKTMTKTGVRGNIGIISRGSAGNYFLLGPTTTGQWVAGNRVRLAALLDAPAVPASGTWSLVLNDVTANQPIAGFNGLDQPVTVTSIAVTDGAVTNGANTVTCATSKPFRPQHVGLPIQASAGLVGGLPAATVINGVSADGSVATCSANATATASNLTVSVVGALSLMVWEFTVPAAIVGHTIQVSAQVAGAAGTVLSIAQITLYDVTALGIT